MKKITWGILALCALFCGLLFASAQDMQSDMHQMPKVIVIMREFLKPGKAGLPHEKTESLFVQAFQKAKWPTYYLGMESLSGKSRALFLTRYDSFEAWEKDTMAVAKNAALSAAISHASEVDGALLDDLDQGVFVARPDLSLRPNPDLAHVHYVDISVFHTRQGHAGEFEDATKMVMAAISKSNPDAHWGAFQGAYGTSDGTYLFITQRKSAAEIDSDYAHDKDFMSAIGGEEGMKKLDEMSAHSIESNESNLFMINPRMSYMSEDVIKADPDFWRPKMPAAPAAPKKTEEKPTGNQ